MNEILIKQCSYLIDDTLPNITNISNLIALLYHEMENINWLGFYICDETNNECTLGPFQGKVACTRIPYGKGVVGTCAKTQETQRIEDVHKFPGHIACDCASNSEICIPIKKLDNRNQVKIKKISMIFHGFYCTLKIPEEKALFFRVV